MGSALPEALVKQVYDRTPGVPLFVEEFTKMVQGVRSAGHGLGKRERPDAARPRESGHASGPDDGPAGQHGTH